MAKRGRKKKMPRAVQQEIRRKLKRGTLTKHGYSMSATADKRHEALSKAVKEFGAVAVYRKLLLLRLWNREQNPKLAEIAESDAMWIGKTYGVSTDGYSFK